MNFLKEDSCAGAQSLGEIKDIIERAIRKVGGEKEKDLCKYIPGSAGGYIHHFTLKKIKDKCPEELMCLIDTFILKPDRPEAVPPKRRMPRGLRKKKGNWPFTKLQVERLLHFATQAGDQEMISILSPGKSLSQCKKELMQSIRRGEVNFDLWHSYVDTVNGQNASSEASSGV